MIRLQLMLRRVIIRTPEKMDVRDRDKTTTLFKVRRAREKEEKGKKDQANLAAEATRASKHAADPLCTHERTNARTRVHAQ